MRQLTILLAATWWGMGFGQDKVYQEFNVDVGVEYAFYFKEGLYEGQERHFPALSLQPQYYLASKSGNHTLTVDLFFRLDVDKQRTHWDIRELYWLTYKNDWELSVGFKKIYWGTAESAHLVDIINQTDQVESFDGEEKLGQPMVHFSWVSSVGTFDLFGMTYFRTRVFPGEKGRLRTPLPIEDDFIPYESDAEEWRPDFAIRWSNTFGPVDVGLSHFYGTGREPILIFEQGVFTNALYGVIHQTGFDAQLTVGAWLWKLEMINRLNDLQDVLALVGGFEYTFGNIKDSGVDIGVLAEYLYDSRGDAALGNLDNDLFVGSRIALNDVQSTEFLAGAIFDLNRSTKFISLEASRRFGDSWKVELEARIFSQVTDQEFVYFIREDSFMKASLTKFF